MSMEMRSPAGADPKDALLLQGWFSALRSGGTREDERLSTGASDRAPLLGDSPDLRADYGQDQDR